MPKDPRERARNNARQLKTWKRIFTHPTPNDIPWKKIRSLLLYLGYTIKNDGGSAVTIVKNGIPKTVHTPHGSGKAKHMPQDAVRRIRNFMKKMEDVP